MFSFRGGLTDQTIYFELVDSTTGLPKTGLVYNSAGAACYYTRNRTAATAITLATLASPSAAHSDGGFIEVSATNAPGLYRLDLPDAVVAAGTFAIITLQFTGVKAESALVRLDEYSETQTATSAALTLVGLDTLIDMANVVDGSPTAGGFITSLVGGDTDFFKDMAIKFTSGDLAGQARRIATFNSGTGAITVAPAFTSAPANGDNFSVLPVLANDVDSIIAATSGAIAEITGASDIPATPTLKQAVMLLYMKERNDTQDTATERRILNNAGTEVLDAAMNDDGTTFSQGQLGAP